jgi:hypothetical protein
LSVYFSKRTELALFGEEVESSMAFSCEKAQKGFLPLSWAVDEDNLSKEY